MSNHSWHSLLPASLRSGVLGPAAVLAGGNAVGMGVGLAAAPMLCRLYTPDEFGNFAVFSVTAAMLGAVCTLRFEQAIPLPRSRRMAAALTSVAALQVVFYSVGFTILAFALGWTDARDSFVSLVP